MKVGNGVMTPLESFVGEAGQERLIVSFVDARGSATEQEIIDFVQKCGEVMFTAKMIQMAAEGKFGINWSEKDNDFVFGLALKQ